MSLNVVKKIDLYDAFKTNAKYYYIMKDHHGKSGGCALHEKVKTLILENAKENVLDAGCGEGSITKWFSKKLNNTQFFGVDISPIGIKMSKKGKPKNCQFQVGNLENLEFEDSFFDLVYTVSVIEHVKDIEKVIKEFRRILKKGGKLIIRVGNGGTLDIHIYNSFFNYIFRKNKIKYLKPNCKINEKNKIRDSRQNFDHQEIPSDVLLKLIKKNRFKINYFSTTESYKKYKPKTIKQVILKILLSLPFFPFNHLGSVIFLMAEKK